jgi:hypothetical protein
VGRAALILCLLGLLQEPPKGPSLEIQPDAWPRKPRTPGQRFTGAAADSIPLPQIDAESGEIDTDEPGRVTGQHRRWRVVAVTVRNPAAEPLEGSLASPSIPRQRKEVRIRPGEWARYAFVVEDRTGLDAIRFELRDAKTNVIATASAALPAQARVGYYFEAATIAMEFLAEQAVRPTFQRVPAAVEVVDHAGRPLPGAQLTLVHAKLGLMVEGTTGANGAWMAPLLAGEWQVWARAQLWPRPAPEGQTVAAENPRVFYLAGALKPPATLRLAPDTAAALAPEAPADRFSIVPSPST